ncbi:MAG: UvrD-helicase domain-containing protein [Deltaproteobacteria bacterium]|jgi:DNA helicase-2/ATP-dependent DNA helicase PcrA|nr:UvrD-helicase domain-containing protein [Deltaproteobacteria bacterium]
MKYMKGLNESQKQAVMTTEGAVRVAAGPGAGKTKTLTSRYCYLVDNYGISPRQILTSTFTNKAAQEMKRRVQDWLGDLDLGFICTFHAFCAHFLKDEIHVLNFPANFQILDTDDQKHLLAQIFSDLHLSLKELTIKKALDTILEARKLNAVTYVDLFYLMDNELLKRKFLAAKNVEDQIFLRYIYEQKKIYACDFNDLIAFAIYILERFPDIRQKWQEQLQYVMVDEFQDLSRRQYKLARLLAGYHGNIFIVGDPDQAIYSWRGAHVHLFLDFPKKYPNAVTIDLNLNYRSTPEIIRAADNLINYNVNRFPRVLKANRPSGPKPLYFHANSDHLENEWVAERIELLRNKGLSLNDIAIIYRAHSLVTRDIEEVLTTKKIPYRIFSGTEFYARKEVKDAVCYLRMLVYADDASFLRTHNVPSRKIGRQTLAFLREYAEERGLSLYQSLKDNLGADRLKATGANLYVRAIERVRADLKNASLDNALQALFDLTGYEASLRLQGDQDRLDNLAEFKRHLKEFSADDEATLEDFLNRAALFSNIDRQPLKETVKLMTIHSAKGLEFKQVFLIGLSEGLLPNRRSQDEEEMEEERRLAYVAMTRAIDGLYLSDSAGKTTDGHFKNPSRFLREMGIQNLELVRPQDQNIFIGRGRPTKPRLNLENLLTVGELVVHKNMGPGQIIRVDLDNRVYVIKFEKLATERSLRFDADLTPFKPSEEPLH